MGPYVVLDLDALGGVFELVLLNIGDEPAFDVVVRLKPTPMALGGTVDLATLPLFTGLGVLRPQKEIRVFIDPVQAVLARKPRRFKAEVSYRNEGKKQFTKSYAHDFASYQGIPALTAR